METLQQEQPLTLLADLTRTANSAFYWQSFNPERRGAQTLKEHEAELIADMAHITEISDAETAQRYCAKYKAKLASWLHSESNCASAMITGPARFPVNSQRKKHDWAANHYTEFREFRKRMIESIERAKRRAEKAQIDPMQDLQQRIADREKAQEQYKQINAIIRKYKTDQTRFVALVECGLSEQTATELLKPDFANRLGIPSYRLTNNLAEIKRLKDRLSEEIRKSQLAGGESQKTISFDGGEVIINRELDRVQIKHDSKPSAEVITAMKRNAFKWSPSQGVWQRQLTANAIYATRQLLKIDIAL